MAIVPRTCLLMLIYPSISWATDTTSLISDLLVGYQRVVRPNLINPVNLTYGLALYQLVEFDVKAETTSLLLWQRTKWFDDRLRWNPEEYGNITDTRLEVLQIWIPDLMPYNDVGSFDPAKYAKLIPVQINYRGEVNWLTPVVIETTCKMDVTEFPFDEHQCEILFGSWQYSAQEVDVICEHDHMDLTSFTPNSQWDVIGTSCERKHDVFVSGEFSYLLFSIIYRRLSEFYVKNVILPNSVLLALSSLVFFLPNGVSDRAGFGITVTLALCVNLMVVTEYIPETSKTFPALCNYFLASIFLSAMSIVVSIVTLRISAANHKPHRPSQSNYSLDTQSTNADTSCNAVRSLDDIYLTTKSDWAKKTDILDASLGFLYLAVTSCFSVVYIYFIYA